MALQRSSLRQVRRSTAETGPCALAGRWKPRRLDLWNVLKPEGRGGVYGNVVRTGATRVGDTIRAFEESKLSNEYTPAPGVFAAHDGLS